VLAQLERKCIRCIGSCECERILDRFNWFVGHNRYCETLRQTPHAVNVGGRQRLLHNVDAASLEFGNCVSRSCLVPALVDINSNACMITQCPLDRHGSRDITEWIAMADFDKEKLMQTRLQLLFGLRNILVGVSRRQHPKYRYLLADAATEQRICA
jgi:hypothetical protein